MSFYLVTTKCGHVGKTKFIPITFPVEAIDGREAARLARNIPRVKHDHKDAIICVEKVSQSEFFLQKELNDNDPYLKSKNKQEQNCIKGLNSRILNEDDIKNKYLKSKDKKYKKIKQSIIDNQYYIEKKYYSDCFMVI